MGETQKLKKASITLNDCLACSGCITSAESVLIGQQNHMEFLKLQEQLKTDTSQGTYDHLAVSLSLQPIISFASKFGTSPDETRGKLSGTHILVIHTNISVASFYNYYCRIVSSTWSHAGV